MRRAVPPGLWILFFVALFAACDDYNEDLPYAPSNCNREEPESGYLIVMATINSANPSVVMTVYQGDWDQNVKVRTDTVSVTRHAIELPADEYYSVLARYMAGPDTILVLDGARLSVESDVFRDATCYSVPDREVDVRLKF